MKSFSHLVSASALVVASMLSNSASAQWGDLTGTVTFDGAAPALTLLHKKGDNVKDKEVCSADDVPNETLVVNAKNNGVANVFIYLKKKPEKIHPDLAKPASPTVDFDQKTCRFLPHALVVRTDQKVRVLSDDAVAHNTHTYPIKNKAVNFVIAANDRKGQEVPDTLSEKLPFKVGCDIHSWMNAYWLVVDHPYAAVTDADGKFKISNLPAGNNEFVVWQESVGYVNKAWTVQIKAGENSETIKFKP